MATDSGGRLDEVKTQFAAREGLYKLSSISEYSRPNRTNYSDGGNSPVAVSFTELREGSDVPERVCFNIGKEIYVYPFKGLRKVSAYNQEMASRPICTIKIIGLEAKLMTGLENTTTRPR